MSYKQCTGTIMDMKISYIHVDDSLHSLFFFFKQKTAYDMRISDCSSDVCSSDLAPTSDRSGTVLLRFERGVATVLLDVGVATDERVTGLRVTGVAVADEDRKSVVSGKSVSVRVDLGGRRIIKKKT